jgi:hypothetical protein
VIHGVTQTVLCVQKCTSSACRHASVPPACGEKVGRSAVSRYTEPNRGRDVVAIATGLILIVLLPVVIALVEAARTEHWRAVAVQRRMSWEQRNAAAVDGSQGRIRG